MPAGALSKRLAAASTGALLLVAVAGVTAGAAQPSSGEVGPRLGMTGNGRQLDPQGRLTAVGDFPTGAALTPDGRFYWTVSAGHGRDDVQIVDVSSGRVIQTLALPGAYVGVAFAPDGLTAYVSGEPKGNSVPAGPTRGDAGDVVHVFSVDPDTGAATEQPPIQLPATSGGSGQSHAGAVIPGFPAPPGPTQGSPLGWPEGLAVTPDGRTLVIALNQADQVALVDLASRSTRTVKVGAYPYGVAIARDGRSAFVTNEYDGTVSVVDLASAAVRATIPLGSPGGDKNSHPEGIVQDPLRDHVYVAVANRDLVTTVDTGRRRVVARVSVGEPYGIGSAPVAVAVSPDGRTLYAADAGEDAVAAISLVARPSATQAAKRIHTAYAPRTPHSIALYLSRLDAAKRRLSRQERGASHARRARLRRAYTRKLRSLQRRYLYGAPTRACAGPSKRQDRAYGIRIVRATRALQRARRRRRGLPAAKRRYARAVLQAKRPLPPVSRCGPQAGEIAGLPANRLVGRIPVAAYPSAVAVTPDGGGLLWLAAKGLGSGPNPGYGTPFAHSEAAPYGTYDPDMLLGRVGALARPTDVRAQALSSLAARAVRPADLAAAPGGSPLVGANGGPSNRIKHVFYIVKENRTYDQLFGSDPRGDGDPALEVFDDNGVHTPAGGVTPNAHSLARTFPLLDHFYADSEVSVDGHLITSGGYATDYVQKALHANYANRGRVDEFGTYPVTFPPNDFVFDQAVKQGISFRNYGEFSAGVLPTSDDGRPTYRQVQANTMFSYPFLFGCDGLGVPPNGVNNRAICDTDSGTVGPGGALDVSNSRFDYFQQQFDAEVASGQVPALNYITLPNDHTNGVEKNYPTPRAMVADNDLGLGQLVDLISHSPIWSQSAIFVVEDDSQDGADHVDAHRMPAFVISPWARRGAVIHSRYDQESALRTIELILGLHSLSLYDGVAAPMWDVFTNHPNYAPYSAIQPEQSLTQTTSSAQAHASGPLAAQLPYGSVDLVPQELFDRIIWRSVYGPHSTPPPPGPNASPDEAARAAGALRAFESGGNVRRYLSRATPPGDQGQDGGR